MRTPDIELLWCDGCPSTERALDELRAALRDVGLGDMPVHSREIRSDSEAEAVGFVGSPTILIGGEDVAPLATVEQPSLACRVYRRRDGRISPTPDPDDVREALRRALARAAEGE
jgi:glutaredoxin